MREWPDTSFAGADIFQGFQGCGFRFSTSRLDIIQDNYGIIISVFLFLRIGVSFKQYPWNSLISNIALDIPWGGAAPPPRRRCSGRAGARSPNIHIIDDIDNIVINDDHINLTNQ